MKKTAKVTPIRKSTGQADSEQDRESRILREGRSKGQSSEGRSQQETGEQGISNRGVQEESERQSKVTPIRQEANTGKRKRTAGDRQAG